MAFDYKKEFKEFYLPAKRPGIVHIPRMQFVAVRGSGNPNEEGGQYKAALNVLYAISYGIKMSKKGEHKIEGYFDYVVPPLEGFWWQDGIEGIYSIEYIATRMDDLDGLIEGKICRIKNYMDVIFNSFRIF